MSSRGALEQIVKLVPDETTIPLDRAFSLVRQIGKIARDELASIVVDADTNTRKVSEPTPRAGFADPVLREKLETAFRRFGGLPALGRAEGGTKKIIDIVLAELAALADPAQPETGVRERTIEECAKVAQSVGQPVGAGDGCGTYIPGSSSEAAAAIRALLEVK